MGAWESEAEFVKMADVLRKTKGVRFVKMSALCDDAAWVEAEFHEHAGLLNNKQAKVLADYEWILRKEGSQCYLRIYGRLDDGDEAA